MTETAARFLEANARSPVVYLNAEGIGCTFRLADGSVWKLSRHEARKIGQPRLAHLCGAAAIQPLRAEQAS